MAETIKAAIPLARYYMKANIPVWVSGPPGVGKSDMWEQIAAEDKIGFIDVRLGMMDLTDVMGLPCVVNGETTWARPVFWPNVKRDGERGIILYDELSDASRSMQSVAYQIILNRRAGPHVLPPGWYPAAAGNRREDRAAAQAINTALANRFAHIDIVPDAEAFVEWANKSDISHLITGFIRFRPQLIHSMEGADLRAFPTPRAWARASKVVDADPKIRHRLMLGLVGEGAAAEFEEFMKVMDLPDFKEVVSNPKQCRIPDKPASKYAMSSMLARYVTRKDLDKVYQYIKRSEFGRDFAVCCMLDATKRSPELTDTRAYIDFANDNQDLCL